MGGIQSNIGLFSGINTSQLIEQLLAIEARPRAQAQARITQFKAQQAALLDVNSSLLALRTAAGNLRSNKVFQAARAVSSDAEVLSATASSAAVPGTYNLTVGRLVTTQQQISRGFADRDTTALGATRVTVEVGGGRINADTALSALNGGEGVSRGKIVVTDSSGASATVDLSTAVTVRDVLEAISAAGTVRVTATVDGDRLRITDDAGGAGSLTVANAEGYTTASSLGIAGTGTGSVTGQRINALSRATPLASLNDGLGVAIRDGQVSLRVTDREGITHEVRLGKEVNAQGEVTQTAATSLGEVIDRISTQTGGKVVASINADGTGLTLTDTTGFSFPLTVAEGSATDSTLTTARDLGILGSDANGVINGRRILSGLNTTLAANLNGGSGVGEGTFRVTRRNGSTFDVAVGRDDTVDAIVARINQAAGATIASLNRAGNGVRIADTSAGANLVIADLTGSVADNLNIATAGDADGVVESGNLQARWISGATRLSDLNARSGVGTGTFRITDSNGVSTDVAVGDDIRTLSDLVNRINSRPIAARARINDTGDGLLLEDASGGGVRLKVEDVTGTVARRLNLAGEASTTTVGENRIDGTYERTITLASTDTLDAVVRKINEAGAGVSAAVLNDGSSASAFRVTFTSRSSGSVGRAVIDADIDLGLSTLAEGRDAVVFFGSTDPARAALLTSSSNTLDSAIGGVSINLNRTSSSPIELVISRDVEEIETSVGTFVETFNAALDRLRRYDTFDPETNRRGTLFGDSTVDTARRTLLRLAQAPPLAVTGRFQFLFQVGLSVGEGGRMSFDKQRFREAYESDPRAVEELFVAFQQPPAGEQQVLGPNGEPIPGAFRPSQQTRPTVQGVAELFKDAVEGLTNSVDGLFTRRNNLIDDQVDLQQSRVGDMTAKLERKRARLEAQFLAMERSIAALQAQQSALGSIGLR